MADLLDRQIIGLDLGASRVKAVVLQFRPGEEGMLVRDYAIEMVAEGGEPLQVVLKRVLRRLRTRCRDCAIAMWPGGAMLRYFDSAADRNLVRNLRKKKP